MIGHNLSPKIGWIIGALAVLGACFRAWNEQYERAESLATQHGADPYETIEMPPTPEELKALDALEKEEEAKAKLTIAVVDVRLTAIVTGNHATFTESHEGAPSIVMSFKNNPSTIPGEQTESFYKVSANLTYVGVDRTEHIDYGNWLDEYTCYVDFKAGETRDLVISTTRRDTGVVVGLYNGKRRNPLKERIRSGMTTLYGPDVRPLPKPPCEVTVTLVSDGTTLLNERYQMNWTDDGKVDIKKVEKATSSN
jgi:hypothetical protein